MTVRNQTDVQLSVVIPCYNEEEVLPLLTERLGKALPRLNIDWEVIFVDDGSADKTRELLEKMHSGEPRFKVLGFSRNFGHQAAVAAGIAHSSGDVVAIMDADLQDPPELLEQCLDKWRAGYSVIYAVRQKRKEGIFKKAAYAGFYRLLKTVADINIPLDSGDFCVMDRKVVDILNQMPERNIFLRGMRAWSGFKQIGLPYERQERAAGATKYPLKKLVRLALDGIFSFSTVPLRLATWLGLFTICLCLVGIMIFSAWRIFGLNLMGHVAEQLPGWTAGMVVVMFLSGIQLTMLGIMGEYMARIYDEVKGRPRWIVETQHGWEEAPKR